MTVEPVAAEAPGHADAELSQTVVRGFVRDDPDWRQAIEDALVGMYRAERDSDLPAVIDAAMMRAIHAAIRTGAVVDLGVVSIDSRNPLRRLAWRMWGQQEAARRAEAFNTGQAARAVEEG